MAGTLPGTSAKAFLMASVSPSFTAAPILATGSSPLSSSTLMLLACFSSAASRFSSFSFFLLAFSSASTLPCVTSLAVAPDSCSSARFFMAASLVSVIHTTSSSSSSSLSSIASFAFETLMLVSLSSTSSLLSSASFFLLFFSFFSFLDFSFFSFFSDTESSSSPLSRSFCASFTFFSALLSFFSGGFLMMNVFNFSNGSTVLTNPHALHFMLMFSFLILMTVSGFPHP